MAVIAVIITGCRPRTPQNHRHYSLSAGPPQVHPGGSVHAGQLHLWQLLCAVDELYSGLSVRMAKELLLLLIVVTFSVQSKAQSRRSQIVINEINVDSPGPVPGGAATNYDKMFLELKRVQSGANFKISSDWQ